ncbi:hypothetical protein ABMA27_006143 [Loxostege sticticalis]|uniref:Chemosensory protein n=1 Tax=Loxostege sticticalis TaxID=481309 RepID=A0ABR3HHR2_LOXSC
MKFLVIVSVVVALAFAETYSTAHDNLDVESIVMNPKKLEQTTHCFLDKGGCDKATSYFRSILHELTETACAKCTPAQKHLLKRYLEEVRKTSVDDIKALMKKYDPESKYYMALIAALNDF